MAVVQRRSIVAAEGFDYADAFEVPMSEADDTFGGRAGSGGSRRGSSVVGHGACWSRIDMC